jgi:hypothetical protein
MIGPQLMTAAELADLEYCVGDSLATPWEWALLAHVKALDVRADEMRERLDEAIGQRAACRDTIGQLRAILMPGSTSRSHDELIAAARGMRADCNAALGMVEVAGGASPVVHVVHKIGDPVCSHCGRFLMFSARKRGDGRCGPCSRGEVAP